MKPEQEEQRYCRLHRNSWIQRVTVPGQSIICVNGVEKEAAAVFILQIMEKSTIMIKTAVA